MINFIIHALSDPLFWTIVAIAITQVRVDHLSDRIKRLEARTECHLNNLLK